VITTASEMGNGGGIAVFLLDDHEVAGTCAKIVLRHGWHPP
jgi:hypothetical protein